MHPTTPQEIAEMRYYVDVAYEMLMSRRRAGASADEIERRKRSFRRRRFEYEQASGKLWR